MTAQNPTEPQPQPERWIYAGQRISRDKQLDAWLPEPEPDQPLGEELWFRHRGARVVGGVYEVLVSRPADTVRIHGTPGPWLHPFPDRDAVARLEIADRTARDAAALLALQRKAAKNPALGTAIKPLRELAATLATSAQVRALLAYVTEEVYAARYRRR